MPHLCIGEQRRALNTFRIIAFTHKNCELSEIGKLHIAEEDAGRRLQGLKQQLNFSELMFLSTCNRVEYLIVSEELNKIDDLSVFLNHLYPEMSEELVLSFKDRAEIYDGENALQHLFNVASSIDSLVVGEREIITQVRSAYEKSNAKGLTGDLIRLVIKQTIETAKDVYTQTDIARNPVSVVSLAYHTLKNLGVKPDARVLIVGAGITNTNMARFLKKHGLSNFVVFNRSLGNAQKLAEEINGQAYPLTELAQYKGGFDVLLTCTSSSDLIITKEIYNALLAGDKSKKVVIDLAVPNDFDTEICNTHAVHLIEVNTLQEVAKENLRRREKELDACKAIIDERLKEFQTIYKTRKVELAMSEVPKKVKEIREMAVNTVFAKDIESLDDQSKEVLDKVIAYLEKKYISVPMKMAKDILLDEAAN